MLINKTGAEGKWEFSKIFSFRLKKTCWNALQGIRMTDASSCKQGVIDVSSMIPLGKIKTTQKGNQIWIYPLISRKSQESVYFHMKAYSGNQLSVYNTTSSKFLETRPVSLRLGVIHPPRRAIQTKHLGNEYNEHKSDLIWMQFSVDHSNHTF